MLHLESLICYSCEIHYATNLFNDTNRRPIVGTCGHTVCFTCSELDPNGNCPICKKSEAFELKTVNFGVKHQLEEYRKDAFQICLNWWKTLISDHDRDICSGCHRKNIIRRICLTCQQEKNLKDLFFLDALCEPCADQHLREGKKECNKTPVADLKEDFPQIPCTKCESEMPHPQICTTCFHKDSCHINADRFTVCANCIIDHHSGHKSEKASEDPKIRHKTYKIIAKLVRAKLNSMPETECVLRKLRLDLTEKDLIQRAQWMYEGENLQGKLVEETIESLENQFRQLESIKETCHCVKVWEDVERLKIHDWNGQPPHLMAMCLQRETIDDVKGCPLHWKCNKIWRRKLLKIIKRNEVLTEPVDDLIYV